MLYNVFISSGTTSFDRDWEYIAIDESLLKKIVEHYLKGHSEFNHVGKTYTIASYYFQIYQINPEFGNDSTDVFNTFKEISNKYYGGRFDEESMRESGSNVTSEILKGREWGDLKENYFNIYINDGKNKPAILALNKLEVDSFLDEWALGNSPIWIAGRRIDLDNPKSIKIFDINFEWLSKDRGDITFNIIKYVNIVHNRSHNPDALRHFGKDVSDKWNIKPFGRSRPKAINFNWDLIHPEIVRVAKSRFNSPHYADAVEAAFKEINDLVKKEYLKIGNEELDGVKLMRTVFSPTNPKIKLTENISESDKNIQEGYMNIFAGVMIGIRNPKAHANIVIDEKDAWEKIIIASHLMKIWDNRIIENEKPTQTP